MMFNRMLFLFGLCTQAWAGPLDLKREQLGAWHYVHPFESYPSGSPKHHRQVSTPTALSFGDARERIAVMVPGSTKVAEFKEGHFDDVQLPEEWAPLSLAVDRDGKLHCLVQHAEKFLSSPSEYTKRWTIGFGRDGWETPVPIPYTGCDRLEFDAQNRLWALGTNPRVGFLTDGHWTTFTYSNDRKLGFLPLRLAEDAAGRVVLFAHQEPPGMMNETSRLVGTLVYADGKFIREPKAKVTAFGPAESRRYSEPLGQPGFDREHGYVCHTTALNAGFRGPKTLLRAGPCVFMSFGNEGLLWANAAELAAAPLATNEWELLEDITVPPALDAAGHLWVGRGRRLLKLGAAGEEAMTGALPARSDMTVDFDPLDRPWMMNWHGASEGPVAIADQGALRSYSSFAAALQGNAAAFAPGRIFPFALKTQHGVIAAGGPFFDAITVIDAKGPRTFTARQISRAPEPKDLPRHGYNPFNGGEPWMDAAGQIYTKVDHVSYVYDSARRSWSLVKEGKEPPSALEPLPPVDAALAGLARNEVEAPGHGRIFFRGFHFYLRTDAGEKQLDSGLNPLAFYPFWSTWYESPGMTQPRVDPQGHLWISDVGPYAGNRKWLVSRKAVW